MPAEVILPWGSARMFLRLTLTNLSTGNWQGWQWRTTMDWSGVVIPHAPGHGNPNIPNPLVVYNTGIYDADEYQWQREHCPSWERWLWKTGTKPRKTLRVFTTDAVGEWAILNEGEGQAVDHDISRGHGIWYFERTTGSRITITFDCFLDNVL